MAAVCDICAKKPGFGNNRPWSRKITKRRFDPNIQRVRATVNGTPKRLNVCTGCLKAGKVTSCPGSPRGRRPTGSRPSSLAALGGESPTAGDWLLPGMSPDGGSFGRP